MPNAASPAGTTEFGRPYFGQQSQPFRRDIRDFAIYPASKCRTIFKCSSETATPFEVLLRGTTRLLN
jgi:hypothetical protein